LIYFVSSSCFTGSETKRFPYQWIATVSFPLFKLKLLLPHGDRDARREGVRIKFAPCLPDSDRGKNQAYTGQGLTKIVSNCNNKKAPLIKTLAAY
jgi:hypothetical protein